MNASRLYTLSLTILVVLAAFLFHLNPDNFLADDAYFYPQIADHIVQGHGSTFHQYSFTNGYQPLWMAFCIVAAGIAQGDKMLLLHLLGFFQWILFVATVYYLFQITREAKIRFFSAGLAFLTILMLTVGGLRLFEAHLAIALQMVSLYLFLRLWNSDPSVNALGAASILLGMVFLARTDAFFFSASYGIVLGLNILKEPKPAIERFIRLFALAAPAVLIAFLYMTFNNIVFGHPVPVSGVIKSSYPYSHVDWHALGAQGGVIVSSTLALLLISIPASAKGSGLRAMFMMAFAAIFCHAAYIILFSWGSQWYYVTAFAIFPVALSFIFTRLSESFGRSAVFSKAICLSILLGLALMVTVGYLKTQYNFSVSLLAAGKQALQPHSEKSERMHLVDDINHYIEPGAGVAVFDSPGVLAYFTHARILPVDGLVNDWAYDREIVKEGFISYLKERNIRYFIAPLLSEGAEYRSSTLHAARMGDRQYNTVYAPIQKVPAGTFSVRDQQVVFTSASPIPGVHSFHSVSCWQFNYRAGEGGAGLD